MAQGLNGSWGVETQNSPARLVGPDIFRPPQSLGDEDLLFKSSTLGSGSPWFGLHQMKTSGLNTNTAAQGISAPKREV